MRNYFVGLCVLFSFLTSCKVISTKRNIEKQLPSLGTIGEYEDYLLNDINRTLTVADLNTPIRLKAEEIVLSKRKLFRKDSNDISEVRRLRLEILDKLSLINAINKSEPLVENLKSNTKNEIVISIEIEFPGTIHQAILNANEVFLVQEKQKTLSIEVRNSNGLSTYEFSNGIIKDFKTAKFCWAENAKSNIVVFGLTHLYPCEGETFSNPGRAKEKNEFKF